MSEKRELVKSEANPMALLQAAIDKGVNPDQLEKLIALQERWDRSRAAERFAEAISGFQRECPVVLKQRTAKIRGSRGDYSYNFADYSDVMAVAGPALSRHGIVVTFTTELKDRLLGVTCRVRVGTHVEETHLDLPIPNMSVNDAQQFGAAVSYGKRYVLCAALNVVVSDGLDDDAHALDRITREQADEIRRLLVETGADERAFLDWADGGIPAVEQMTKQFYPKAIDMFRQKRIDNEKKQANGKGAKK